MLKFLLKLLPLLLHEGADLLKEHLDKRRKAKEEKEVEPLETPSE